MGWGGVGGLGLCRGEELRERGGWMDGWMDDQGREAELGSWTGRLPLARVDGWTHTA